VAVIAFVGVGLVVVVGMAVVGVLVEKGVILQSYFGSKGYNNLKLETLNIDITGSPMSNTLMSSPATPTTSPFKKLQTQVHPTPDV
jgi:hypothetical protein